MTITNVFEVERQRPARTPPTSSANGVAGWAGYSSEDVLESIRRWVAVPSGA